MLPIQTFAVVKAVTLGRQLYALRQRLRPAGRGRCAAGRLGGRRRIVVSAETLPEGIIAGAQREGIHV